MKNVNDCQITKVQPQGVASHLPIFLPISAWLAYKTVAFKKSVYSLYSQLLVHGKSIKFHNAIISLTRIQAECFAKNVFS